ncbi:MAG: hypothetical protein IJF45_06305 [Clostridia bacterium]|nr:hypothetical protein [Clostridia bacterium]
MTEHVKQKHLLTINRRRHAWSVSFDLDSVSPDGTREDLARNMVANVAIGNSVVRNDFDRVSIFKRPIFNATWDSAAGRWVDLVAQGEPGFSFSPTEENREVLYRCQPFWYRLEFEGLYGPKFVSVTDTPQEGYKLAPMFKDGQTYEYRPCFELGIGSDGKPHSRAGLIPYEGAPVQLMSKVRTYDGNAARTETMAEWFSDYLLLLVEFGTRNLQGIMHGVAKGELMTTVNYNNNYHKKGIYADESDVFEAGKMYRITYTENGIPASVDCKLLSISETKEEDFGYYLDFEMDDVASFVRQYKSFCLYEMPAKTGQALPLITSASSGRAGEDLYSPIVWRGKENPWGNFSSFICDVLFELPGEQGIFYPYKLSDVRNFDGTLNEGYTKYTYQPQALLSSMRTYIASFTTANEECFLIPAAFHQKNSQHYFAACVAVYPFFAQKGLRFLRVGGDYTTDIGISHAAYELFGEEEGTLAFGGRLILQEAIS